MHRFQHLLPDLALDDRDGDLLRPAGHGVPLAGPDLSTLARRQGGSSVFVVPPKGGEGRLGATLRGA